MMILINLTPSPPAISWQASHFDLTNPQILFDPEVTHPCPIKKKLPKINLISSDIIVNQPSFN
jgi:hypothetical protein